jgi:hypothetical protein
MLLYHSDLDFTLSITNIGFTEQAVSLNLELQPISLRSSWLLGWWALAVLRFP